MARQLHQSISNRSIGVCSGQYLQKEVQGRITRKQFHGCQGFLMYCNMAQKSYCSKEKAEKVGYDRKVAKRKVHCNWPGLIN